MMYLFKFSHSYAQKNKLTEELSNFVESLDATLIKSAPAKTMFKLIIKKKLEQLHEKHSRCKPIEIQFQKNDDNESIYVPGSWHANIYLIKQQYE